MKSDPLPDKLYFKIGEVSTLTDVEPYILRYWESEFKLIKPYRTKTNQRLYRKKDVESIIKIKKMLYEQKFTIAGAKKKIKEAPEQSQQNQPSLGFINPEYVDALKTTRNELKDIVSLLEKPL
jgi:DNA-binding transcriptional MerR regulator